IWFRFHQEIFSHYFWMVDDIAIVEGPSNDLYLDMFKTQYDSYSVNEDSWQYYKQVPMALFDSMFVYGEVYNNGGEIDSNSIAIYEVTHDQDCNGNPGLGSVHYVQESLPNMASFDTIAFDFPSPFYPSTKGEYTVSVSIQTSAIDQDLSNNVLSSTFTVSDTVYAKDDGTA